MPVSGRVNAGGKMLIGGRDVSSEASLDVLNPFDGTVVATVPSASPAQVAEAIDHAERGARAVASMSRAERASVLRGVSDSLRARDEELAVTIATESGKTLREARAEVARAVQTFALSAEEAGRLAGEIVPFDAAPTGGDRFGFYLRVPLGIVAAITPFNFPLNLAAHKVGPAFAAGNAVVLKPSSLTPLSGIELGRTLLECGLPPDAISVITGPGGVVGGALVDDPRVRMVTFTGSAEVGKEIAGRAGVRKLAMELGSNSAVIVTERGDVELAAERSARGAFALAGQVCISVQRVLVHKSVFDRFVERAVATAGSLSVGDQLKEGTDVGPMIDERNAERAQRWVGDAVAGGAELLFGGGRTGTVVNPAILTSVPESASLWSDEAFAPVMAVRPYEDLDEAFRLVNASRYGLQAGIFSDGLEDALRAAHEVECGGIMVNDVPAFRVDLMPYGGVKDSGIGREGPAFAAREMTELRVVGIRRPLR